ncbi:hypothetical protein WME73_06330 [Sorangium sp. So ce302]|uniref:hypothetical protein n=1 Tax=unclassified Sorangium TaxID=2621164 RepID=UPI003F60F8BD
MTGVMRRRHELAEIFDSVLSVFRAYRGADENRYPAPAFSPLSTVATPALAACEGTRTLLRRRRRRMAVESAEASEVR